MLHLAAKLGVSFSLVHELVAECCLSIPRKFSFEHCREVDEIASSFTHPEIPAPLSSRAQRAILVLARRANYCRASKHQGPSFIRDDRVQEQP